MFAAWIAHDPSSARVLEYIRVLAATGSDVLVRGPAGVGKNLVAELLHYASAAAGEPLVKIDCCLPAALLPAELFGSDCPEPRRGRLELAGAGTLVLDEVAALPLPLQARLLHAIEDRMFTPAGSERALPMRARVIALSAVDLIAAVARRTFREDLYYRLQPATIAVPPLRDRPADIRPLAEHFLAQLGSLHRKPHCTFSPAALAALQAYSYPGNVRELKAMVERAVLSCAAAEVTLDDLPPGFRPPAPSPLGALSLEQVERQHIAEVLAITQGKKTIAADILGISRKTLLEKRKRYRLG